jgi:prepilin-type processing-associated H-X9-DG protein
MTDRARAQKCMNNLRQIGASAHLYANEHENRFPRIEVSPDEPIYPPEEEVKPILETLQPYGVTEAVLQCAADLRGPNWYAKRQTSYLWDPRAEDELTNAIKVYRRGRASVRRQAVVQLATDYEAVHPADAAGARKRMNILYADGHVKLR